MTPKPTRILYIDDYPLDRALIRDTLNNSGYDYQLIEAANREEFNQLLAEERFDLVLSDFNILGFTGLQVLDAVRENFPHTPVIIVTGTGSEEIAAESIKRGAADYIVKTPQRIRRLPNTIQNVLAHELLQSQRRDALEQLRESEKRHRLLLENLKEGVWGLDQDGRTTFVNPAMADLLGYPVEDMQGKSLFKFMDEEAQNLARTMLKRREEGIEEEHEFTFQHQDGSPVYTRVLTSPLMDQGGKYRGAVSFVQDITEKKQFEETLRRSEHRYRSIVQDQSEFICRFSPDGKLTFVNQAYQKKVGSSAEELLGKSFFPLIPEEDRGLVKQQYQSLTPENPLTTYQHRVINREGEIEWQEWTDRALFNSDGDITEYQSVGRDITDRVRAQQELQESERQLSTLMSNLPGMAYRCRNNKDWEMLFISGGCEDLTGYLQQDLIAGKGKNYADLIHPQDLDLVWEKVQAALEEDRSFEITYRIQTAGGREKWVWERGIGTRRDQAGNYLEIEGFISDITERRQAELEKKQTRQTLETVLESIDAHIYVTDFNSYKILYMNNTMIKDFGGDFTGEKCYRVFRGEDQPCSHCRLENLLSENDMPGEPSTWEDFNPRMNRWYLNTDRAVHWSDGRLAHIQIAVDITSRKKTEKALQEREELLRRSQEIAGVGSYIWNLEDDSATWSKNMYAVHGLDADKSTEKISLKTARGAIHPEDREFVSNAFQQMVADKQVRELQFRIVHPGGEIRTMLSSRTFEFDDRGNPIRLIGVYQDITRQEKTLEDLKRNRQLLISLSQAAHSVQDILEPEKIFQTIGQEITDLGLNISILTLDEEGKTLHQRYTSFDPQLVKQFDRLTGLNSSEFRFKLKPDSRFLQLIHNQKTTFKAISEELIQEALPGVGQPLIQLMKKLFKLEYALFSPLLIGDQPRGLLVVLGPDLRELDVPAIEIFSTQASTALKNALITEMLRTRNEELIKLTTRIEEAEEKERTRLARELHDQVGQSLALLGFNLNMIKEQLEKSEDQDLTRLDDAQAILEEITSGIRSVMDDLRPSILDDYGLQAALNWYVDKFRDRTNISASVEGEALKPRLSSQKESMLFRIAQEALTNVARHARAGQVTVTLQEEQNQVQLIIEDDGVGFDPDQVQEFSKNRGWGLVNMEERAARIDGKFRLDSSPGQGTAVTVLVPRE
ncbi:MAG: PAS domain S-box protein [Anaerolineales bacterium]|nr:PAS domain S-box protein [Anaerolineales bacterium]